MMSAFDVVAEPGRRAILDALRGGPRAVGELVEATGLSQPNTSRHLRILRDAGLVQSRAAGQRRLYELEGEGFGELARWLAPYVLLWQGGLDALERRLERRDPAGA
jgi:DNA-binding transcriptional ArsR family regulator